MTTTSVDDAVILPQSQGTGLSGEDAVIDSAINGVLSRYVGGEYVATEYSTGLQFQNHDAANDTVEVGPGIVFIQDNSTSTGGKRSSNGNPQSESSTTSGYDTELPEGHTYAVLLPTATQISVTDSTLNEVYVDLPDVTANNSVNLEHDGSSAASPGNTSLKIGETNPDDASADTRANDDASPTFDSLNGIEFVSPGDDIQTKVNTVGVGGILIFESGEHLINSTIQPQTDQTWVVAGGVDFKLNSDVVVFDISDISDFEALGTIKITDPSNNQTTKTSVVVDGCDRVKFNLFAQGVYNACQINGDTTSVRGCDIDVQVRSNRGKALDITGEVHDNVFGLDARASGNPDEGLKYETFDTDGGNIFRYCRVVGDYSVGLNLLTYQEAWFSGATIIDGCGLGMRIKGGETLVFDALWSSSNNGDGILIAPDSGNVVDELIANSIYAWRNGNHGILFSSGAVERMQVSKINVNNNDENANGNENIEVANTISDSYIGNIQSYGGQGVKVTTGNVDNTVVSSAYVTNGISYSDWSNINGYSEEAAGSGNTPSEPYPVGTTILNTDDNTLWFETDIAGTLQL